MNAAQAHCARPSDRAKPTPCRTTACTCSLHRAGCARSRVCVDRLERQRRPFCSARPRRSTHKLRRSCRAAAIAAPRCSQERGVQGVNNSELVSSTRMSVDDTLASVPQRGQVAMIEVWVALFMCARAFMAEKVPMLLVKSGAQETRIRHSAATLCASGSSPIAGGRPIER